MKEKQLLILGLMVFGLWIGGCSSPEANGPELVEFGGQTMGTWYNVKVADKPEILDPEIIADAIAQELDNVNQKMSTYIDNSELSQFNQSAVGVPFEFSQDTFEVISKALSVWRLSHGAFDVTVGPLVNVWGFGPEGEAQQIPNQQDMLAAWERVGSDNLVLHIEQRKVEKTKDVYLDLSAIAKGYAVDRVAMSLEALGIRRYLVEVGGEIRAGEAKSMDLPWRIAVEQPDSLQRKVHKVVELRNNSMATSGDYRNFFEVDAKRYSHTIDPRTGKPIDHQLVSVSVIAPSCADADAWATAFMVLGPDQGMKIAEANHMPIYMILRDEGRFTVRYSSAFDVYIDQ